MIIIAYVEVFIDKKVSGFEIEMENWGRGVVQPVHPQCGVLCEPHALLEGRLVLLIFQQIRYATYNKKAKIKRVVEVGVV